MNTKLKWCIEVMKGNGGNYDTTELNSLKELEQSTRQLIDA